MKSTVLVCSFRLLVLLFCWPPRLGQCAHISDSCARCPNSCVQSEAVSSAAHGDVTRTCPSVASLTKCKGSQTTWSCYMRHVLESKSNVRTTPVSLPKISKSHYYLGFLIPQSAATYSLWSFVANLRRQFIQSAHAHQSDGETAFTPLSIFTLYGNASTTISGRVSKLDDRAPRYMPMGDAMDALMHGNAGYKTEGNDDIRLLETLHDSLQQMIEGPTPYQESVCHFVLFLPDIPQLELNTEYIAILQARQCTVHVIADFGRGLDEFYDVFAIGKDASWNLEPGKAPLTYTSTCPPPVSVIQYLHSTVPQLMPLLDVGNSLFFNYRFLFPKSAPMNALKSSRARYLSAEIIVDLAFGEHKAGIPAPSQPCDCHDTGAWGGQCQLQRTSYAKPSWCGKFCSHSHPTYDEVEATTKDGDIGSGGETNGEEDTTILYQRQRRFADFAVIVDESSSFTMKTRSINAAIFAMESELNDKGIGNDANISPRGVRNLYSVIGFASGEALLGRMVKSACTESLTFPVMCLPSAISKLGLNIANGPDIPRDHIAAIIFAISNFPWREGALRNIILFSDVYPRETDGRSGVTADGLKDIFRANNITPHFVVPSNFHKKAHLAHGQELPGTDSTLHVIIKTGTVKLRTHDVEVIKGRGGREALEIFIAPVFDANGTIWSEAFLQDASKVEQFLYSFAPTVTHLLQEKHRKQHNCRTFKCDSTGINKVCTPAKRTTECHTAIDNHLLLKRDEKRHELTISVENDHPKFHPPSMDCHDFSKDIWYAGDRVSADVVILLHASASSAKLLRWLPYMASMLDDELVRSDIGRKYPANEEKRNRYRLLPFPWNYKSGKRSALRFMPLGNAIPLLTQTATFPTGTVSAGDSAHVALGTLMQDLPDTIRQYSLPIIIVVSHTTQMANRMAVDYNATLRRLSALPGPVHFVQPLLNRGHKSLRRHGFFHHGKRRSGMFGDNIERYIPLSQYAGGLSWVESFINPEEQSPGYENLDLFTSTFASTVASELLKASSVRKLCVKEECRLEPGTCDANVKKTVFFSKKCGSQLEATQQGAAEVVDTLKNESSCPMNIRDEPVLQPTGTAPFDIAVFLDETLVNAANKWLPDLLSELENELTSQHPTAGHQNLYNLVSFSPKSGYYRHISKVGHCGDAYPVRFIGEAIKQARNNNDQNSTEMNILQVLKRMNSKRPSNMIAVFLTPKQNWTCDSQIAKQLGGMVNNTFHVVNILAQERDYILVKPFFGIYETVSHIKDELSACRRHTLTGLVSQLSNFFKWWDSAKRKNLKDTAKRITHVVNGLEPLKSVCRKCNCLHCTAGKVTWQCGNVMSQKCDFISSRRPSNQSELTMSCPITETSAPTTSKAQPTLMVGSLTSATPEEETQAHSLTNSGQTTIVAVVASLAAVVTLILILLIFIIGCRKWRRGATQSKQAGGEKLPSIHSAAKFWTAMAVAPAASELKIIPSESLVCNRRIGRGQYGEVHIGILRTRTNNEQGGTVVEETVAIKTLKDTPEAQSEHSQLLEEYDLQKTIGNHPNVVKILLGGLYNGLPCIVMEYMAGGNLHSFLRNIKGAHRLSDMSSDECIQYIEKLDICRQVSMGMQFLASKNIVHRDLACRNVLVRENPEIEGRLEIKISDLGLSRKGTQDGIYLAQTSRALPLKWMAMESIASGTFSEQSDVWAFGVLAWEVETCGEIPYKETPNALLLQGLVGGYRLEKPSLCSEFMYSLMSSCWSFTPAARPTFDEICRRLSVEMECEMNYLPLLQEELLMSPRAIGSYNLTAPTQFRRPSALQTILIQIRNRDHAIFTTPSPTSLEGESFEIDVPSDCARASETELGGTPPRQSSGEENQYHPSSVASSHRRHRLSEQKTQPSPVVTHASDISSRFFDSRFLESTDRSLDNAGERETRYVKGGSNSNLTSPLPLLADTLLSSYKDNPSSSGLDSLDDEVLVDGAHGTEPPGVGCSSPLSRREHNQSRHRFTASYRRQRLAGPAEHDGIDSTLDVVIEDESQYATGRLSINDTTNPAPVRAEPPPSISEDN